MAKPKKLMRTTMSKLKKKKYIKFSETISKLRKIMSKQPKWCENNSLMAKIQKQWPKTPHLIAQSLEMVSSQNNIKLKFL